MQLKYTFSKAEEKEKEGKEKNKEPITGKAAVL